ncbi:hypothetical protein POSPLADRAFT_1056489 [Postia placenta MAD-698-R-SB12]|uniref:Uncharacterized protein n=1 Tax=Postia placenta MAD-698-R-SB12 TaxID=670580 RepID=A0A1X6N3C5_9APHY|nr:hypothetical protein POSPLADRAFT_1056489 [Postia placenta MAD-698-R-SB12]OSX63129.1 hypothetical protein POSPLADRAFT_1056489 [Postia placenta MAD-698-R-SB12]
MPAPAPASANCQFNHTTPATSARAPATHRDLQLRDDGPLRPRPYIPPATRFLRCKPTHGAQPGRVPSAAARVASRNTHTRAMRISAAGARLGFPRVAATPPTIGRDVHPCTANPPTAGRVRTRVLCSVRATRAVVRLATYSQGSTRAGVAPGRSSMRRARPLRPPTGCRARARRVAFRGVWTVPRRQARWSRSARGHLMASSDSASPRSWQGGMMTDMQDVGSERAGETAHRQACPRVHSSRIACAPTGFHPILSIVPGPRLSWSHPCYLSLPLPRPPRTPPVAIYQLMVGGVVPRPIAFISGISADGVENLSLFRYPLRTLPAPTADASALKDIAANILASRGFNVKLVSEPFPQHANACARQSPAHAPSSTGSSQRAISPATLASSNCAGPASYIIAAGRSRYIHIVHCKLLSCPVTIYSDIWLPTFACKPPRLAALAPRLPRIQTTAPDRAYVQPALCAHHGLSAHRLRRQSAPGAQLNGEGPSSCVLSLFCGISHPPTTTTASSRSHCGNDDMGRPHRHGQTTWVSQRAMTCRRRAHG